MVAKEGNVFLWSFLPYKLTFAFYTWVILCLERTLPEEINLTINTQKMCFSGLGVKGQILKLE